MIRENRMNVFFTLLSALCITAPAVAFERDTHYYLKVALALKACCFDYDESLLIASADWMQDENNTTVAGAFSPNNTTWHAFTHSEQRFNELWRRAIRESDSRIQLIKLGQFLHFVEDWESHAGYGHDLGHALDTFVGSDPDSLRKSRLRNEKMVQSTLSHLIQKCVELKRPLPHGSDADFNLTMAMDQIVEDGLLDDLWTQSNSGWREGDFGGLSAKGEEILKKNKQRIERFIKQHFGSVAGKKIPTDFEAIGLPEPKPIKYNADGDPVQIGDLRLTKVPDSALGSDVKFELFDARLTNSGCVVKYRLANDGQLSSDVIVLRIVVAEIESETLLARQTLQLAVLDAGARTDGEIELQVPNLTRAGRIIVWGRVDVDDRSANNNQAWSFPAPNTVPSPAPGSPRAEQLPRFPSLFEVKHFVPLERQRHIETRARTAAEFITNMLQSVSEATRNQPATRETADAIEEAYRALGRAIGERAGVLMFDELQHRFIGPISHTPFFYGEPKIFIKKEKCEICVVITAYTSGGNSTEKLKRVLIDFLDVDGKVKDTAAREEPVWSAFASKETDRVLAQTIICFPVGQELCRQVKAKQLTLRSFKITLNEEIKGSLGGTSLEPQTKEFSLTLDADLTAALAACCER